MLDEHLAITRDALRLQWPRQFACLCMFAGHTSFSDVTNRRAILSLSLSVSLPLR